jgi:hypothetical protein
MADTWPFRFTRLFVVLLTGTALTTCELEGPPPPGTGPEFEGIGDCCWDPNWQNPVLYFAPIVYQDADASWADFITRFTFDNDWNGGNNWDNTFSYPLYAFVYASVVETFAHYFIFYGFFHPRDWCTTDYPPWWWCDIDPPGYPHEHENDFEGILVTVDKRVTTPEWPYGQIITIETVYHTSVYPTYRNCTFTAYTVVPDPAFKGDWTGCIVWQVDDMMFASETPPARPAIFVQARGHGVSMRNANWNGFPGSDGVIYYPADPTWPPEVPPSVLSPPVPYQLQYVTTHELWWDYPKSLWSKRLTSGGLATSTYYRLHQDPVGPWDILYGHRLNCVDEPCGAPAPWGQKHDGLSSVHLGDWHNHPAWTWSQHYQPGPTFTDSLYYPYCRAPECRMVSSMYETNYYWDDAAAPQDYVDFDVAGMDSTLEQAGQAPGDRVIPPELRWEFDSLPMLDAAGTDAPALVRSVDDVDWGHRSQTTSALRLTGTGVIQFILAADFDPSQFRYAYVRFRRIAGTERAVSVAWRGVGESAVPAERLVSLEHRDAGAWEVAMIPLHRSAAWAMAATSDGIVVRFDGEGTVVLEVDFVIVSP